MTDKKDLYMRIDQHMYAVCTIIRILWDPFLNPEFWD